VQAIVSSRCRSRLVLAEANTENRDTVRAATSRTALELEGETCQKDDAVRFYCEGMTIDEVARAIGRSYSATRRLLARYAVLRAPHQTRMIKQCFGSSPTFGK
jgi:hypothetical protein